MVRALPATRNQKSSAVPSAEGAVTSENVFDVIPPPQHRPAHHGAGREDARIGRLPSAVRKNGAELAGLTM